MNRVRYRIRFAKTDLLRWISHHDLLRLWERTFRRVDLPLSMSEGFHPKPRMNFPSALALGVEGLDEVVEVELAEELAADEVYQRLVDDRQPGLTILRVDLLAPNFPKAQLSRATYRLAVPAPRVAAVTAAIDALGQRGVLEVQRDTTTHTFDLAAEVAAVRWEDDHLLLTLNASRQASMRPTDYYAAVGLGDLLEQGEPLTRVRVELEHEIQHSLVEQGPS